METALVHSMVHVVNSVFIANSKSGCALLKDLDSLGGPSSSDVLFANLARDYKISQAVVYLN